MNISIWMRSCVLVVLGYGFLMTAGWASGADHLSGRVTVGGAPVAKATVTLWEADADCLQ